MSALYRIAALSLACLATAVTTSVATAEETQNFPSKPITIVVPYPPGATTDLLGRLVAEDMRTTLGQPVIVENRGGAAGSIGSAWVARAANDGYTLLVGTDGTHGGANFFLTAKPSFDPIKDFTPISNAARNIVVLVTHPSSPFNTVQELVDYAKKNPGKLSYGSSGNGSPHHLSGVLLNQLTGIDMLHVPYKGGGPAVVDVMGNQIPLVFASLASVETQIKAGKLKALGITQADRYKGMPDLPTIGETIKGFDVASWLAFFAPAGTPQPVVNKLNDAVVNALHKPAIADKLNSMGLLVIADSPKDLADYQRAYFKTSGDLIKSAGVKVE